MTVYQELITLVRQIEDLIESSQNPDGSVRLDEICCRMALEFAKTEIKKHIGEQETDRFINNVNFVICL